MFLRELPAHLPTVLYSFTAFTVLNTIIGPLIWRAMGKEREWKRRGLDVRRESNNWSIHLTSMVHALLICPLAFQCLDLPALDKDRAFGWDERVAGMAGVACGYFLWDSIETIVRFSDIGFVIHGLACLMIYAMGFRPFLAYYAARFLLWELSTPFLNIHWFLDKTNRTGSTLQLINGFFLLSTFFGVRIVYGGLMSYRFFYTLKDVMDQIPLVFVFVYGVGNVVLNGLNWFWLFKMISALKKRFTSPPTSKNKTRREPSKRVRNGNGVVMNGNGHGKANGSANTVVYMSGDGDGSVRNGFE
ncbi:hypothetical protein JAAARDRAFT_191041 [Jaapia argillacea MUCL 33604]|uniref:TLC domain-containing protein n=1 Tax=Jaapia argillacea MUCL 33604 TaxID=933084 RepID=A0A067QBM3_9AGAM|nr:hypothetical protein JAAARDRAFT_191041 [Jaapia argillacea MUCL 33604]